MLALAASCFLVLGGPVPVVLRQLIPGLSPFLRAVSAITASGWYQAAFWGAPAAAVLAAAVWRGRVFCRWLCPAGLVYEVASNAGLRRSVWKRRYNGVLFWGSVFCAAYGVPVVLFFDPLMVQVNTLNAVSLTVFSIVPGLVLPIFILLSVVQPQVWCTHFCPLGYFFDLCDRRDPRGVRRAGTLRRDFLRGVLTGVGLVAFSRGSSVLHAGRGQAPVLPPGAGNPRRFAGLCVRCYACVRVCPTQVLRIGGVNPARPTEMMQPCMDYQRGFCDHLCNECLKVCPTGAIRHLTLAQKERVQVGVAGIDREICLAWGYNQYCVVCQEYCPYQAVHVRNDPDTRIPHPTVNPSRCRGCGYCEYKCPALKNGSAITVSANRVQNEVTVR